MEFQYIFYHNFKICIECYHKEGEEDGKQYRYRLEENWKRFKANR